jgi:anthranilate synthase/aminodeoxychorismate synthase-like glutamine amidotransferase
LWRLTVKSDAMILMIDNYDSFTYNLVQYLSEIGADLQVVRNDEKTVEELIALQADGIVISPGPGRPEGAGVCMELIQKVAGKTPLLGVCLGHQSIAQAFGGTIDYAPTLMHGKVSQVTHTDSTLFSGIASPFVATRYHSLVVNPDTVPDEFEVTAQTEDVVVMAIESDALRVYGVQFHPESIMTPCGKDILRNFLQVVGGKVKA